MTTTHARPVEVRRRLVEGVPVLEADGDGSTRVELMLRVGVVDEGLPGRGLTHLVEHLAMRGTGDDVHGNASVGLLDTRFWAQGEPDRAAARLLDVVGRLRDLPLDGLDAERRVLRTEAAGRERHAVGGLARQRWGLAGPGLLDEVEHAVTGCSAADVHGWAAARMHRGAAALVLSGPVPDGLAERLVAGLADGPRVPVPRAPEPLPHVAPGWQGIGPRSPVLLSAVVPRIGSASVADVWQRVLHRRLRDETSLCYTPQVAVEAVDATSALLVVALDALPDVREQALAEAVATLEALAAGDAGATDVDALLRRAADDLRRAFADVRAGHALAATLALEELLGAPTDLASFQAGYDARTRDDVVAATAAALPEVLGLLPEGTEPPSDWAPLTWVPRQRPEVAPERWWTWEPLNPDDARAVQVLPGQALRLRAAAPPLEVPLDDVLLVSRGEHGQRWLLLRDGDSLVVLPWLYRAGGALVEALDTQLARAPVGRWVAAPTPDDVRPSAPPPGSPAGSATRAAGAAPVVPAQPSGGSRGGFVVPRGFEDQLAGREPMTTRTKVLLAAIAFIAALRLLGWLANAFGV